MTLYAAVPLPEAVIAVTYGRWGRAGGTPFRPFSGAEVRYGGSSVRLEPARRGKNRLGHVLRIRVIKLRRRGT